MSSASTAHKFEITRHALVMNLFVRCSCGTPHGPFSDQQYGNCIVLWAVVMVYCCAVVVTVDS